MAKVTVTTTCCAREAGHRPPGGTRDTVIRVWRWGIFTERQAGRACAQQPGPTPLSAPLQPETVRVPGPALRVPTGRRVRGPWAQSRAGQAVPRGAARGAVRTDRAALCPVNASFIPNPPVRFDFFSDPHFPGHKQGLDGKQKDLPG